MTELTWRQIEEIARRWCSMENNNIELSKEQVIFWNHDNMHTFEFDITSHPKRKEIEKISSKIKQYEKEQRKKINMNDPLFIELAGLYGKSPNEPDHREVIGMVKSGKHDDGSVTYESILGDCFLLTRAKADKKYMILTDEKMYEYFRKRCEPILLEIKLIHLDLNKYMYLLDDSVTQTES